MTTILPIPVLRNIWSFIIEENAVIFKDGRLIKINILSGTKTYLSDNIYDYIQNSEVKTRITNLQDYYLIWINENGYVLLDGKWTKYPFPQTDVSYYLFCKYKHEFKKSHIDSIIPSHYNYLCKMNKEHTLYYNVKNEYLNECLLYKNTEQILPCDMNNKLQCRPYTKGFLTCFHKKENTIFIIISAGNPVFTYLHEVSIYEDNTYTSKLLSTFTSKIDKIKVIKSRYLIMVIAQIIVIYDLETHTKKSKLMSKKGDTFIDDEYVFIHTNGRLHKYHIFTGTETIYNFDYQIYDIIVEQLPNDYIDEVIEHKENILKKYNKMYQT